MVWVFGQVDLGVGRVFLSPFFRVLVRAEVARRRVRVMVIVAMRPGGDEAPGVLNVLDAVFLEQLVTHPVMKRLDKTVMPRLARSNERQDRALARPPSPPKPGK